VKDTNLLLPLGPPFIPAIAAAKSLLELYGVVTPFLKQDFMSW
jgi:hypothetical protein